MLTPNSRVIDAKRHSQEQVQFPVAAGNLVLNLEEADCHGKNGGGKEAAVVSELHRPSREIGFAIGDGSSLASRTPRPDEEEQRDRAAVAVVQPLRQKQLSAWPALDVEGM